MNKILFQEQHKQTRVKRNLFKGRRDRNNHAKEIQYLNGYKGSQLFLIAQQKV